jgi:hypothetical protein
MVDRDAVFTNCRGPGEGVLVLRQAPDPVAHEVFGDGFWNYHSSLLIAGD